LIKIRNLHKRFGEQVVLRGVSLDIERGKTTAVVGPSGTGKSVLLKIITGLLDADAGEVLVDGESMTGARTGREKRKICSRMGVLFQGAALFDSMNLLDNVAFPLRYRGGMAEQEVVERSIALLDDVGLQEKALALPGEVSIGMRKRVGIARALVTRPDLILFDEPNTGLDPEMGQEIYDLIKETQGRHGFTGIVVSHEIPEVFQVCDRVAMLYQGEVQIDGTVTEFLACDKPVVKQFIAGNVDGPIQMS
jgi:phospholipid/cholesterol/gamma-HCH transport system ATP-binding protein